MMLPVVLGRFFRAELDLREDVAGAAAPAQQVAEQFGDRDEAAAIVAQVDDDVGDPLVAERLESGAQLRRGRADKGAKVDIAIIAPARSDTLRAIAAGNQIGRATCWEMVCKLV